MSLPSFLRALKGTSSISRVKTTHGKLAISGLFPDLYVSNHLMSLYVKHELIDDACSVFSQMPEKNVVSWTILISGYSTNNRFDEANECFRSMVSACCGANEFTYVSVLSACASTGAARAGKEIHARLYRVEEGLWSSFVSNSLVNLYAKCGMISMARRVFDRITRLTLVSWGSILVGYCRCKEYEEAMKVFLQAKAEGVEINEFIFSSILSACAGLGDPAVGKQVHCLVIKSWCGFDQFVETGMIDMYVTCGELDSAHQVFLESDVQGLGSWAALIGGFAQKGLGERAMHLFHKLISSGFKPNEHLFPSVLVACSSVSLLEEGKQLHSLVVKSGFRMSAHIGNAVTDFYAKCGLLEESSRAFEEMEERDIVSWNAVIARHVGRGDFKGAIDNLKHMLLEDVDPNPHTYSSILSLCADLPAKGWGQQTHTRVIKPGFNTNVVVGSALIDMYAKCGRLGDAHKVFDGLSLKNLVSWNGMLVGYAQHGLGKEALEIFDLMQKEKVMPNDITFIGVLSALGHVGLVNQAQHYFDLMGQHSITPRMEHYACMVDLFARAGEVERAYEYIRHMPVQPNKVIWRSLLAGCKTHGNLGIGRQATEHILESNDDDVPSRIMLSTVYADTGLWDERVGMREIVKKGLKKVPGCSWIEVNNKILYFFAQGIAQAQENGIFETLNGLAVQMVDAGYVAEIRYIAQGISNQKMST